MYFEIKNKNEQNKQNSLNIIRRKSVLQIQKMKYNFIKEKKNK